MMEVMKEVDIDILYICNIPTSPELGSELC